MHRRVTFAEHREALRDKFDRAPYWSDFSERMAINDALRTWNMLTGMWRTRLVLETKTDTPWYVIPGCIHYNTRITWDGIPLDPTSVDSLDQGRVGWEREASFMHGKFPEIPEHPVEWAPAGVAMFAIWPIDSAGCNSLVLDGVVRTPIMENPNDFIDIGEEDFTALLGYELHILAFKEGGARFTVSKAYYKAFIKAAAERNSRLKTSSLFRHIMGLDLGRFTRPVADAPVAVATQEGA